MTKLGFRVARLCLCALAIFSYAATPAFADPINVTGSAEDVKAFKDMIEACRMKSKSFNQLITEIEKAKDRSGKVNISVGRKGNYVDNATGGMGHTDVNLSNVEKFPDPPAIDSKDAKDTLKMPDGVPPWATTRCEILAHFIGEAHSTANTASKSIDGGHRAGMTWQNKVREDFHQKTACSGSYNYYSEGKPENGEGDTGRAGFLYTGISYGEAMVRLNYLSSGELAFTYIDTGGGEYVPPKKTAPTPARAPAKPPAPKKNNGGVTYDQNDPYAQAPAEPGPRLCRYGNELVDCSTGRPYTGAPYDRPYPGAPYGGPYGGPQTTPLW